ncbi:MAG: hypothetical protein JXR07_00185 [Reichenbachiella sp.]
MFAKYIYVFLASLALNEVSQNQNEWQDFLNASHQIGLCAFRTNEASCQIHKKQTETRKNDALNEDMEYFSLNEQWAENRITNWAENRNGPKENFVLLFDLQQRLNPYPKERYQMPLDGFMILNMKREIKVIGRPVSEHVLKITLSTDSLGFLENRFWREFMTGRPGRIVESSTFDVISTRDPKKACQNFSTALQSLRGE